MMTFNDFVHKNILRIKATSNMKIYQLLSSIDLNKVAIYVQDGPFESDTGIVKLHQSKGSHWVAYTDENYFNSYGRVSPQNFFKFY